MKKKYITILVTGILCMLMFTACGAKEEAQTAVSESEISDTEIIDTVLENFELLARIPRPSHNEKQVSDFLVNWAKDQGFSPKQDKMNNVMFDVPATEGCEDLPLCILQGHMDMVVAVEDGKKFDPQSDPITVIRDEETNTLTADGTSLGADDGAGDAIMMAAAQGKMKHGPLRILITVDEEDGMEGAFNLDASWFEGADHLINIDNETSDQVLVSTAAGDGVTISKRVKRKDPAGDTPLELTLSGLQGGHSGVEIDKGRMNGLVGLALFLKELDESGIDFELADFSGGTAGNAIPTKAMCTIVVSSKDKKAVEKLSAEYLKKQQTAYAGIDDGMTLTVTEADTLPQVVIRKEKANLIRYITEIIDGVYSMSADMEGLVESSSNLGLFSLEGKKISGYSTLRSSSAEKETEILESQLALAKSCGYQAESQKFADPWPYNPDSQLLKIAKEVYLDQNGEDIGVVALHAGLECGTFTELDSNLDMISIGPDIKNAHTVNETLYLDSIPRVWRLLEGILLRLGE